MAERRKREMEMRDAEKQEFLNKGIHASNVYYINQDKKDAHKAALKGGSHIVAE